MVVGILGAGRIGVVHAENIMFSIPEITLKTIAEVRLTDEIKAWADKIGVPNITNDPEVIMNDPEIDAVLVCSSTDTHADFIIRTAEAGKHIFCEKPIDHDINKIKTALAAVEKAGVKLQIGFGRRFDHNHKKVADVVKAGTVGKIQMVKLTSRDTSGPPLEYLKRSGGIFFDMITHDFDMARFITGSEIVEVFATTAVLTGDQYHECDDYDTVLVSMKFENGAIGVIDGSRECVYGYDHRLEVFGSKGSVRDDNDIDNTVHFHGENGSSYDHIIKGMWERYMPCFREELKAFCASVEQNAPIAVTADDGMKAEIIALAATISAKEGRPVKIADLKF